jgi:hypothetical protein
MRCADGREYTSDQATVWRWWPAFQHDFAARMDCCRGGGGGGGHRPRADGGTAHALLAAEDDGGPSRTAYRRVILEVDEGGVGAGGVGAPPLKARAAVPVTRR